MDESQEPAIFTTSPKGEQTPLESVTALIPTPIGHRPATGSDEELASMQLDEIIWEMRRGGNTFTGIALAIGMSRQSVSERYDRILKRFEAEHAGLRLSVQMSEFQDLQTVKRSLRPKVISEDDPTFVPRAEDVKAYVLVGRAIRELLGIDGLTVDAPYENSSDDGERVARDYEELANLMGRMYDGRIGGPEEDHGELTNEGVATPASPPSARVQFGGKGGYSDTFPGANDLVMDDDDPDVDDDPEQGGQWISGRWVPDTYPGQKGGPPISDVA